MCWPFITQFSSCDEVMPESQMMQLNLELVVCNNAQPDPNPTRDSISQARISFSALRWRSCTASLLLCLYMNAYFSFTYMSIHTCIFDMCANVHGNYSAIFSQFSVGASAACTFEVQSLFWWYLPCFNASSTQLSRPSAKLPASSCTDRYQLLV